MGSPLCVYIRSEVSHKKRKTAMFFFYVAHPLTTAQVREMLGFSTPMELDALLQRASVYRNPTEDELDRDLDASRRASTPNPRKQ
jgi:hypothetical protein